MKQNDQAIYFAESVREGKEANAENVVADVDDGTEVCGNALVLFFTNNQVDGSAGLSVRTGRDSHNYGKGAMSLGEKGEHTLRLRGLGLLSCGLLGSLGGLLNYESRERGGDLSIRMGCSSMGAFC